MTEPVSSSSSSHQSPDGGGGMTIDIRPMIEDVSQVMTKHITSILSGVIGEYTVYKETHDTIMGLPCVRKLQERINELEMNDNNKGLRNNETISASGGDGSMRREDEIHQLQSAIAELNRYIIALESKVDMKTVSSYSQSVAEHVHEEESIRLEIHENEPLPKTIQEDTFVPPSSYTKNVIVSSSSGGDFDVCDVDEEQEEDDTATETTEDLASLVETVKQEIENEAEEQEETAEEQEDEAEEQEEEAEEQEETAEEQEETAEEQEETAEEQEETAEEQEEEAEEEQAEPEEEAEIEVSEIKIKGKTYFTTDPQNGIIYACVDDDVGDEVGVFKNGVAVFNKGKK